MKAVIFDLGDVLVFCDHMRGCEALAKFSDKSADEIYNLVFASKLEELQYNCGTYTDKEWYEHCVTLLNLHSCSYEAFAEAWGDIFSPNAQIERIFEMLRPEVKILLLSNTNGLHWAWAQKNMSVLAKHFPRREQVILSSEEKCRKPDRLIFERALARAGVQAGEAIFIDDKRVNIEAFQQMGGNGIVYSASSSSIFDLEQALDEYGCIQ